MTFSNLMPFFPIQAFIPGVPGYMELIILGGIVLLLFGSRLPKVMYSLGKSLVEFKKGVKGIEDDPEKEESNSTNSESSEKKQ